jgi:hypothetical protein
MLKHYAPSEREPVQAQLEFAWHTFENQQRTIRHLDSKAGVFVGLPVFLLTGLLTVAREACSRLHWHGKGMIVSWIYVGSFVAFGVSFLLAIRSVQQVIRPRVSSKSPSDTGLVFHRDILGYRVSHAYYEALRQTSESVLLRDLTVQIFELVEIIKVKTEALQLAWLPTIFCVFSALLNAAAAVYILTSH